MLWYGDNVNVLPSTISQFSCDLDNDINIFLQKRQILDSAFEVMNEASDIIPVRCVLIECNDFIRTKQIYDRYGFKYIGMDKNLHQYFKKL